MGSPLTNKKVHRRTPSYGYEKNVNIQYPLDEDERVDIGGYLVNRLVDAIEDMKEHNEIMVNQLRLLNMRFEEAFSTGIDDNDVTLDVEDLS